jgi:hypothetical protein
MISNEFIEALRAWAEEIDMPLKLNTDATGQVVSVTGFTNPVTAALCILRIYIPDFKIDLESFQQVAEQVEGTIPADVLANGFVVSNNYHDFSGCIGIGAGLVQLCDIGKFSIQLQRDSSLCTFKCVAMEDTKENYLWKT